MASESYLEKLVENTPLALVVIGLILIVIGAAGGWPTPALQVNELGWRVALAVMGAIVAGVGGLLLWRKGQDPGPADVKKYGIRITAPREGDSVYITNVGGTYEIAPPAGTAIWVFEISPTRFHHWPKRRAHLDAQNKQWRAADVYVGGRPGDERFLMAALVGKAG